MIRSASDKRNSSLEEQENKVEEYHPGHTPRRQSSEGPIERHDPGDTEQSHEVD